MEEAAARVRTVREELQRHAAKSSIGFAVREFLLGPVDDELQLLEAMLAEKQEAPWKR